MVDSTLGFMEAWRDKHWQADCEHVARQRRVFKRSVQRGWATVGRDASLNGMEESMNHIIHLASFLY